MSIKAGRTAGKRRQTGQATEKETHTAIRPALSGRSFRMRRKKRLHLRQLLILISRQLQGGHKTADYVQNEMEAAIRHFSENYNTDIVIDEYAQSMHRSTAWFIRSFKQYTGMTPMQYIISVRIANAQRLLGTPDYNVTEVASIVGYDNPLYFSRLFKKQTGISPTEYRKNL